MINNNAPLTNNENFTPFNLNEWRESFILTMLKLSALLSIRLIAISFPNASANERILFIILYLLLLGITLLPIPYTIRAYIILFSVFIIGVNSILAWGPWIDGSIFLITSVVLAGLLFDKRIDVVAFIVSLIFLSGVAIFHSIGLYTLRSAASPVTLPLDWISYIFDFVVVGSVILAALGQFKFAFLRIIQSMQSALQTVGSERAHLEEKVIERTEALENRMNQFRNSAITSRAIAEIQDINELLEVSTKLIAENFDFQHANLFILDEQKKTAFLQASSSPKGKELIEQLFSTKIDGKNLLSTVVHQNRAIITSDTDKKLFIRDENFPATRSRILLPLTIRNNVMGLLDLHSETKRTLNMEDVEILQTLADLTAISFDNVRLLNETRNLLTQLEATSSLQTQQIWRKLTSRELPAYQYTPAGVRPIFNRERNNQENEGLKIPLILAGQSIGSIKLRRKNNQSEWTEREKLLVEKIADQISLALENSRLVEEAQKNAARDQMIANISTRIRETLDIQSVTRTAAEEIRRVFDLKEAEIAIGHIQIEQQGEK